MSDYRDKHLPLGWSASKIVDVAGINPPKSELNLCDDVAISFIPMAAVEAGTGRLDPSELRVWGAVRKGYTAFREGDVLFAKITPCMENGKIAIASQLHSGYGAGSTEFHVLRPNKIVDRKLLLYFVLQESVRRDAQRSMRGAAGQLRVPPEYLEELDFPLPPLPEQRRIVAEIEKQFTRLDAAVAALKRAKANLKRYRASVLKAACEGRLVPTEAELARAEGRDYEPADVLLQRILAERRAKWEAAELAKLTAKGKPPKDDRWKAKYKEPQPVDTSELGELPKGWCWASVEQIGIVQGGIQKQPKRAPRQNAYPYLRVANVLRGELELSDVATIELFGDELEKLRLEPDDLLVVEGNGSPSEIGRMATWNGSIPNCVHQNHIIRIRVIDGLLPSFVATYWNSPSGSSSVRDVASSTSGLYTLSVAKVQRIAIPLPPKMEQRRIVSEIDRRFSNLDDMEIALDHSLQRAERLRQSILKRAFEGKLVPQDPNDEPASVLLERIRAERAAEATNGRHRRAGTPAKRKRAHMDRLFP